MFTRILRYIFPQKGKNQIDLLKEKGLVIGDNTTILSPDCFDATYPWLIEVGDNCLFSTEVKILAHDASTLFVSDYARIGRVTIGNNVYLGYRTTVLCNVKIGDNVIVGAQSLVNKDLPSNGVYAGVPARYMCSIEDYRQKQQALLEECPKYEYSWKHWRDRATEQERMDMKASLTGKNGFVIISAKAKDKE